MRRLILLAVGLMLLSYPTSGTNQEPTVLIEVNASDAVNKLDFSKSNTYLRIYNDGRAEYSDRKGNGSDFVHQEYKLSPAQLKSLTEFLKSPEVVDLSGQYPSLPPNLNFFTIIDIHIIRKGQVQAVGTHNLKFPLGGIKGRKNPQALIDLICRVESLREHARFRVTSEGYCSK
jgi:hypothetical protein